MTEKQEPVAIVGMANTVVFKELPVGTKLYTHPQPKQPLTDGQLAKLGIHTWSDKANARAIEAAHGIKGKP